MKQTTSLSLALVLATAAAAPAATVLIDFSAAAVAPSPWNSFGTTATSGTAADITVTNLLLSDNSGNSSWDVFVDHQGLTTGDRSGFGGTAIDGPVGATSPFDTTGADRPTVDGIFAAGGLTVPITFSDLAANTNYYFALIGGRSGGNGNPGLIELTVGTAVSGLSSNQAVLPADGTILSFAATSTAGGVITFEYSVTDAISTQADTTLNAMSISNIPEPSVALLGALGILGLLRRRRF